MNKKSNEVVQNSKVSERGAADSRARLQALTTRWLPFCNKQIFFCKLCYESSTLKLYKALSSPIFQSLSVCQSVSQSVSQSVRKALVTPDQISTLCKGINSPY